MSDRYAQAVDGADTATFVLLFTADGALVSEFGGTETDTATGVTYRVAHHLREDQSDLVMMVRCEDRYVRDMGVGLIAERRVLIHWTETQRTDDPAVLADLRNAPVGPA